MVLRIPILVVIPLALAVVLGTWWVGTRQMDFMKEPTAEQLAEIRVQAGASATAPDEKSNASAQDLETPPPPPEPPQREIDLGDLSHPPKLQDYAERAQQGAESLIILAGALEEKAEFQRALLAWERVLDCTKADAPQAEAAIAAIHRLRPTLPDWPGPPIQITLNAGTGKKLAKPLTTALEAAARDLERASAGIVKVKTSVTPGKAASSAKGATPVALWFEGAAKQSTSTDVLSFTVDGPEKLPEELRKAVFALLRARLVSGTAFTPPAPLADGESALAALHDRVTRVSWNEFAAGLNMPKKKRP